MGKMKTILDLITPEILGKRIRSVDTSYGIVNEKILTIDRVLECKDGFLVCETTIHDGQNKSSGWLTTFNLNRWEFEVLKTIDVVYI
jgi:hypothetical protein